MGYEGVMIKKLAGYKPTKTDLKQAEYKQDKGTNILKFKSFFDEEGEVIGVHDSKGREKGAAVLEDKDNKGHTFSVRMKGEIDDRKK